MKIFKGLFIIGMLLSATGCATYSNTQAQDIRIMTSGVDNVNCFVENSRYKFSTIAPNKVTIQRAPEDYTIICRKAGYLDVHKKIKSVKPIKKYVMGNLYNGVLPGLLYDLASESIYEYPDLVVVEMKRDPGRLIPERYPVYTLPKKEYQLVASLDTDMLDANKAIVPYMAKSSSSSRGVSPSYLMSEEENAAIETIHRSMIK